MIIKCPNCPDKKEVKDGTDRVVYEICLKCLKEQYGEGDK